MKRLLFWMAPLLLAITVSAPATAQVYGNAGIPLPPPIFFPSPPELIVVPETYVYVVPDYDGDLFFYDGWWWRPWEGRWYRSRYYGSGWVFYQQVPIFYSRIPSGWRNDYRNHRWRGYQWNYQRIPHQEVQRNWNTWERDRYWERQQTWGVQGLRPGTRPQPRSQVRPQVREAEPQRSRPRSGEFRRGRPDRQQGETYQQPPSRRGKKQQKDDEEEGRPGRR